MTVKAKWTIESGGQTFDFELDDESVLLSKREEGDDLGKVLVYDNQLDDLIAKLIEARDYIREDR